MGDVGCHSSASLPVFFAGCMDVSNYPSSPCLNLREAPRLSIVLEWPFYGLLEYGM